MEEIKVGEYIKTVAGYIGKIINFSDGMYTARMKDVTIDLYIDNIKKHKENIIDLIEVGDYVNGEPVEQVTEFEITTTTEYLTNPKDIKSICTKEQFENAEYKIDN